MALPGDTLMKRPAPDDFRDVAQGKNNRQLAEHYGTCNSNVSRWRGETGTPYVHPAPVMPDDFAARAPTMTYDEMRAIWEVSTGTIAKWLRACGVTSIRRPAQVAESRRVRVETKPKRAAHYGRPAPISAAVDGSYAGQAAHFLRRTYPNVYRMSILDKAALRARGIPDDGVNHFHVGGRGILPANDVIELAKAKGWAA